LPLPPQIIFHGAPLYMHCKKNLSVRDD